MRTQTSGCVIGGEVKDFAEDDAQLLVARAHHLVYDMSQSGGRLGHLMRHNPEIPGRPIAGVHAAQNAGDEKTEGFFRSFGMRHSLLHDFALIGANRFAQNLSVEAELIAEVIVHGSDIGTGTQADFANRGRLETALGKDFAGGVDQLGAGGVRFRRGWEDGRLLARSTGHKTSV